MATRKWMGGAPAVAQVDTLTVGGTVEVGDKFKMTINNKTLSVSATTTSTTTTASEIVTAWNALSAITYPEFAEITASSNAAVVTLTADIAGKPFTVTVSTTESDDSAADAQTFVRAASTANAGPNDWSTASNWSGGAVPVDADDVVIENSSDDIMYGLDQNSIDPTTLFIHASFTGTIGLPEKNPGGYGEYRDTYLKISPVTLRIGQYSGPGSGRIKINTGTPQTAVHVDRTGESKEPGVPSFLFKGTHASNVLNVLRGNVGVAYFAGETATVVTLRVGQLGGADSDANVICSSGTTLTTVTQSSGRLQTNSNVTTLTMYGGICTHRLAATITTAHINAGTLYYNSTGTITTANVRSWELQKGVRTPGILDFTQDLQSRTVTTCNVYTGGQVKDPYKTVSFTSLAITGTIPGEIIVL